MIFFRELCEDLTTAETKICGAKDLNNYPVLKYSNTEESDWEKSFGKVC